MGNQLHFAVVIGINCYPGMAKDQQLTTARHDAGRFADWLRGDGGLPASNIRMVTATKDEEERFADNYLGARPVISEVFNALQGFHKTLSRIKPTDWPQTRLYVYAAAHGLAPIEGRGAVIFADAAPTDDFWGTGYLDFDKGDKLYEKHTHFAEVVLLSDCCREVNRTLPPATAWPFKGPFRGPTRRIQGYATQYSQRSGAERRWTLSPDTEARGFFTAALLEGLSGRAPCDPATGIIDSNHLSRYVADRVPQLAINSGYAQNAEITPSLDPISLVSVPQVRHNVTVKTPELWRGTLRLTVGPPTWQTLQDVNVGSEETSISVPSGVYILVAGNPAQGEPIELRSQPFVVEPSMRDGVVTVEPR